MSDAQVPYMFRGEKRVYRVIGLQGETFYGLNVDTYQRGDEATIALVFACLGDPASGSPFKSRQAGKFLVAFEAEPKGPVQVMSGHRLNKLEIKIGKRLSAFEVSANLEKNIPILKAWLDSTLEKAGIMANFNDSAEVFAHFFGEVKNDSEVYVLDLPDLGAYTPPETAPAMDFSQYGKGGPSEVFSKGVDPSSGEIEPDHNSHGTAGSWPAPGVAGGEEIDEDEHNPGDDEET